MNTPFDKFIESGKHQLHGITVHELKHRLTELETLGMADYKVMMFPNEDTMEPVTVGIFEFHEDMVIFST